MSSDDGDDTLADAIGALVVGQLEAQGVGCIRLDDGQAFFFTRPKLEELLAKAIENEDGIVMVLVKRGPEA